jgi:hypothetical protein
VCGGCPLQKDIFLADNFNPAAAGQVMCRSLLSIGWEGSVYDCDFKMPALQQEPWQTVEGIEFRSATVIAFKGKEGPCFDHNEAIIYRGPFKEVFDDDGHVFHRGQRTAVCRKLFTIMSRPPYNNHFIPVEPREEIAAENAPEFDCRGGKIRAPRVTKGSSYKLTVLGEVCCDSGDCC